MEFFAVNGSRNIRLCEATRKFAFDSLGHKYGLDTRATPAVTLDDIDGFAALSPLAQYDAAIERIVRKAPLRLCEGERISGAATLGLAISHRVPATFQGKAICSSISHLTIDFETVLKKGVDHLRLQAESALAEHRGTQREPFARSVLHCLDCMALWRERYLEALQGRPEFAENYRALQRVPFAPAASFYEAVQSLWFTFAFVRLCGNWPGIGRIDELLGEYLKKDLAAGRLTLSEAREILAHFFIKGCEWVSGGDYGSGDAQHYQNIVLGGVDEQGQEVTNEVTFLVLDILEELGISDFPTTVRLNRRTDERLLRRVAEVTSLGGGVLAVYNEELIIESLVDYGYTLSEARKFANDGCWEIQIPGKTCFSYMPFDSLQILQHLLEQNVVFSDFESLYKGYVAQLRQRVEQLIAERNAKNFEEDMSYREHTPCTVVSLFEQGCIEKGCSYLEGGPVYNVLSPHIGGLPDVANSLYAIKKLVFEEKKVSFTQLTKILKNDWAEQESLRRYALEKFTYFGNDNDEVDDIAAAIVSDFADICDGLESGYATPAGISTFGRQLEWSKLRLATAYGRKAGEVLSGNFSPTPATDKEGATAIIRSYCKADLRRIVSGAALDIKLLPSAAKGEQGIAAVMALMRGFVTLGGHFMQLDIADTNLLRAAQGHPEDYPTLSVRISGWNARFVTLNREWQDMIIAQTGSEI